MHSRLCRMSNRKAEELGCDKGIWISILGGECTRHRCCESKMLRSRGCSRVSADEHRRTAEESCVRRRRRYSADRDCACSRESRIFLAPGCELRRNSPSFIRERSESRGRLHLDHCRHYSQKAYDYFQQHYDVHSSCGREEQLSSASAGTLNYSDGRPTQREQTRRRLKRPRKPVARASATQTEGLGARDMPLHAACAESAPDRRATSMESLDSARSPYSLAGAASQRRTPERPNVKSVVPPQSWQDGSTPADSRPDPGISIQENAGAVARASKIPPPVSSSESVNVIVPPIEAQRPPPAVCKFCFRTPHDFNHRFENREGVTCHMVRRNLCSLCGEKGKHSLKYCPRNPVTRGDPRRAHLPPGPATREHRDQVHRFLRQERPPICPYCRKRELSCSHHLQTNGVTTCPELRKLICPKCSETGDRAHTLKFCPKNQHCSRGGTTQPTRINEAHGRQATAGSTVDSRGMVQNYLPLAVPSMDGSNLGPVYQSQWPVPHGSSEQSTLYKVLVSAAPSAEHTARLQNNAGPAGYSAAYYGPGALNVYAPPFSMGTLQNYEYRTYYSNGAYPRYIPNSLPISGTGRNYIYHGSSGTAENKAIPIVRPSEDSNRKPPNCGQLKSNTSEDVSHSDGRRSQDERAEAFSELNGAEVRDAGENPPAKLSSQYFEDDQPQVQHWTETDDTCPGATMADQPGCHDISEPDSVAKDNRCENIAQKSSSANTQSHENLCSKSYSVESTHQNKPENSLNAQEVESHNYVSVSSYSEKADIYQLANDDSQVEKAANQEYLSVSSKSADAGCQEYVFCSFHSEEGNISRVV